MLGGTGYIGPHHVRAALARGHQVAVFNRGKRQADLPDGVEHLVGDRNGDLKAIMNRDWDAVLDLSTYVPQWVRTLGHALGERVKHYTVISTVSAYDNVANKGAFTEQSPLQRYKGSADPYSLMSGTEEYGALKVLCEEEGERQFPGRTLALRLGHLVGPGDWNGFFAFWPVRMAEGAHMMVAGDPSTAIQFIDVRDVAECSIRLIEQGATGVFNVGGPATPIKLSQLVSAARAVAPKPPRLTWVSAEWLAQRRDHALWSNLLFWSRDAANVLEGCTGWMRLSIEKALAKGLTTRPLRVTLRDTQAWYQPLPAAEQEKLLFGLIPETDRATLEPGSWAAYLERERQVLAEWRTAQKHPR